MAAYNEIEGNLITLALQGKFDVIAQGCNCFCIQKAGIAPQFVKFFGTDNTDLYTLENIQYKGDVNKMGQIESNFFDIHGGFGGFEVVNCYTQYGLGNPKGDLDYEALTLCMRKLGAKFLKQHIGLPLIGCGKAGGDWFKVKPIIQQELRYCDVTIVHYKP